MKTTATALMTLTMIMALSSAQRSTAQNKSFDEARQQVNGGNPAAQNGNTSAAPPAATSDPTSVSRSPNGTRNRKTKPIIAAGAQ